MRRLMVSGLAVAAAMTAGLSVDVRAQSKPNFSGSWVYSEEKSQMPEGFSVTLSFPSELVIKQSATEVQTIGTSNHLQPIIATYKLDGSESTSDTSAGRIKAKATWNGNKLVITGTRTYSTPMGDIVVNTTDSYSLSGDVLTVERNQQTADLAASKGTTVYTKATS